MQELSINKLKINSFVKFILRFFGTVALDSKLNNKKPSIIYL